MFALAITKPLFLTLFICILSFNQCAKLSKNARNHAPDPYDPKEELYRELSAEAYFNLPCHQPGDTAKKYTSRRLGKDYYAVYKWMDPKELDFENDNSPGGLRPPQEVVDTDRYETDQKKKSLDTLNPDAFTIFHLCYAASYLYRKGRMRLHSYYKLRPTYSDHLPFEIGYMTQTIMATYQNVLELYEYSTRMEGPENKIGTPHLFFFYRNILEDCRKIIHMCNMMHEVTRKYKVLQYSYVGKPWIPVKYDPAQKFQDKSGNYYRYRQGMEPYSRDYERGIEGMSYLKYDQENPAIFKKIKQAKGIDENEFEREKKLMKPKKQDFILHGSFTWNNATTRRTSTIDAVNSNKITVQSCWYCHHSNITSKPSKETTMSSVQEIAETQKTLEATVLKMFTEFESSQNPN